MGRMLPFPRARAAPVLDEPDEAPRAPLDLDGLFRRYASYVAAVALRLLGREEEVDDVVQDAFLAALRDLPRLRSHAPAVLKGWLATITVRIAYRRLRQRRLRALLGLDRAPCYERIAAPHLSPEDRVLLVQVYHALDELPPAERVAWTLRYLQEEPLDEVARLCACSLATAKRRIQVANQRLQRSIRAQD